LEELLDYKTIEKVQQASRKCPRMIPKDHSAILKIKEDVHDLQGVRVIVDFTPHLEGINILVKETFREEAEFV